MAAIEVPVAVKAEDFSVTGCFRVCRAYRKGVCGFTSDLLTLENVNAGATDRFEREAAAGDRGVDPAGKKSDRQSKDSFSPVRSR